MSKGLSPATPAIRTDVSTISLRRFLLVRPTTVISAKSIASENSAMPKNQQSLSERDLSCDHSGFGCRESYRGTVRRRTEPELFFENCLRTMLSKASTAGLSRLGFNPMSIDVQC